jgi:hypothetical protein
MRTPGLSVNVAWRRHGRLFLECGAATSRRGFRRPRHLVTRIAILEDAHRGGTA